MLKILRKKGVMKRILWVIAVLIIISFGLFGQSYRLSQNKLGQSAGKIFNQKVSIDDYQRTAKQTEIQAMMLYGQNFKEIKNFLNLNSETWDRIILLHEVKRLRIKVSDEELIKTIESYSFFKRNEKFDEQLYEVILKHIFNIAPTVFEESTRDSLKIQKLLKQKTANVSLTDEEALKAYQEQNEKVQVSYVLINADQFLNQVTFDETAAQEYYLAHRNEFALPPMINVAFIRFDFAKHIEKSAALARAELIADILRKSKSFEQAAKEQNLTIETTGFFSQEKPALKYGWPFPAIFKIFQMRNNDVSDPIETADGYHIVWIQERRDSIIPEYEDAKDTVKETWIKYKAQELAKVKAEEILQSIKDESAKYKIPDFVEIAKQKKLVVKQTPLFTREQYLPDLGESKTFKESAFKLTENQPLSSVVELGQGQCIQHLDHKELVSEEDFNKGKEEFTKTLLEEKKTKVFNEFLTLLRINSHLENNIPDAQNPAP